MYTGYNGKEVLLTKAQKTFDDENDTMNVRRKNELESLQHILDLFEVNAITIEEVLLALESFANKECLTMLEMEEKVRAAIISLFGESFENNIQFNLSRRLHDIVISWYNCRINAGDINAVEELYNYQFMIGDILPEQ